MGLDNKNMKPLTLRIIITTTTFLIGVSITAVWFARWSCLLIAVPQQKKVTATQSAQRLEFTSEGYFTAILERDGHSLSGETYKSSDGVKVSYSYADYHSPGKASKALAEELKTAVRIIERSPRLNNRGHRSGERVTAIFPSYDPNEQMFSVCWTDGKWLYFINAPSQQHVLDFEKSLVP
jgi:hypothetical protein